MFIIQTSYLYLRLYQKYIARLIDEIFNFGSVECIVITIQTLFRKSLGPWSKQLTKTDLRLVRIFIGMVRDPEFRINQ